MSQIKSSYFKRKQISWAWLFLSLLAFVTIFGQVFNSYQVSHKGQKKYLEEKIVLDQVLLQKSQEKSSGSKSDKSRFNFLLDSSISSLIEDKNKFPEATVLYALMRYEQGYKVNPSDISLLARQKGSRYSSIYKIYIQDKVRLEESQSYLSLFKGRDIVDRLIRVHIFEKMGRFEQRQEILPMGYWSDLLQVTTCYMFAGVVGIVLIFVYQFKRKKGCWVPINLSFIPSTFYEFDRAGKKALFIAMINLMALIFLDQLVYFFIVVSIIVFCLTYYKWASDPIIKSLRGRTSLLTQLGWGIGAGFVNIPIMGLFGLLSTLLQSFFPPMRHVATDVILNGQNTTLIMKMAFLACVMAPIVEEVLFRGLLLPSLIYRYRNQWWGVVATSFIFAAIHPQGIAGWPALFAVGMMSSLTFIQTGSIIPSIILHMFHNTGLLIMTYVLGLHL